MTPLDTAPPPADDPPVTTMGESMPTPADLRALRTLLGYSRDEIGTLLGGLSGDDVRKLERSRAWFVRAGHMALLENLTTRVNAELEAALAASPPAYLITYPNDGAFRDYLPDLAQWMRYNSAHLMLTARLLDAWILEGHRPEAMELVPASYEQFRRDRALPDTMAARLAWAADYRPQIKTRPGMPRPGGKEEG